MATYLNTNFLELTAVSFGFLNIYFAARASIWNWLFGIVTVSLYLIIFFRVKLYADMGLQFVFLGFQFYGIYQWLYGNNNYTALEISKISLNVLIANLICIIILYVGLNYLLTHYTDSTTAQIDAITTAMSLSAQWMMSKKYLENWYVWIMVDLISIIMYFNKALYYTCALYVVLLMLCLMGIINWCKQLKPQNLSIVSLAS